MTAEGKLKHDILEYLAIRGEWVIRINSGSTRVRGGYIHGAPEGTADLLIVRPIPHWIEIKPPKASIQPRTKLKQAEFRENVLALGHRHCQAESVEQVMTFLNSA